MTTPVATKESSANANRAENTEDLFRDLAFSSHTALNALSEHYFPLVRYHAERMAARLPDTVEVGDLSQAGYFGLRDALLAFDPERGVKFETFCVTRIRGAMLDYIREMDWLPRLVRHEIRVLDKARHTLESSLNRAPSDSEILNYIKENFPEQLSTGLLNLIRSNRFHGIALGSLDINLWEKESGRADTVGSTTADHRSPSPEKAAMDLDARRAILKGCSKQERLVYILYVVEELPMHEVAEHLGLTESRVSQIFSEMVSKLTRRVHNACHLSQANECTLIAERFRVAFNAEEASAARDISAEVIKRLDELNADSTLNFSWIEGDLEYQSSPEDDRAISNLVNAVAIERSGAPSENTPSQIKERSSHAEVTPEITDVASSLANFGFLITPAIPETD